MALAKITLTLEQDDQHGTDDGMAETIALLASLGVTPASKLTIVLECEEEDAEMWRGDLRATLRRRPVGIKSTIKVETKEEVSHEHMSVVTPMDKVWSN